VPTTENATVLRLERRFAAPPERVFDAWTDPELLRRWFHVGPDWDTPSAEVDLREGGRYRIAMREPNSGDVHAVLGEYSEIKRPHRLVYTWAWEAEEGSPMGAESHVTVEFAADGDGTQVVLTHTGFPSEENRDQHAHGWEGCLASLERLLGAA
jgi:uncharacterized protein YndB with AHSA1/START domain